MVMICPKVPTEFEQHFFVTMNLSFAKESVFEASSSYCMFFDDHYSHTFITNSYFKFFVTSLIVGCVESMTVDC